MYKLFSYKNVRLKNESFLRINMLIISLVIYYKNKYGIKIGFSIHDIILEISLTNWKQSPLHKALEEFTEKD